MKINEPWKCNTIYSVMLNHILIIIYKHYSFSNNHLYTAQYIKHDRFLPFKKKSLSEIFGRTKLHKKESSIRFFYLKNLSRF